jgi:hypothetical protein
MNAELLAAQCKSGNESGRPRYNRGEDVAAALGLAISTAGRKSISMNPSRLGR